MRIWITAKQKATKNRKLRRLKNVTTPMKMRNLTEK